MLNNAVLFIDEGGFQLGCLKAEEPSFHCIPKTSSLPDQIKQLKNVLDNLNHDSSPLLLAIPSSWCLCVTLENVENTKISRKSTLAYRLEEHLPLSAEEMTADFIHHDNAQALGVCIESAKLLPLIQSLKNAGIFICHVSPAALLAAQYIVKSHVDSDAILINSDFIELRNGKPLCWNWFNNDPEALLEFLHARPSTHQTLVTNHPNLTHSLIPSQTTLLQNTPEESALLQGLQILTHVQKPWIDLRCEGLIPPGQSKFLPRYILVASIALFLICLIVITQYRAHQYSSLTAHYTDQQIALFKTAMPNQTLPVSIQNRLNSERQRLSNLKGQDASQSPVLNAPSALTHLKNILKSLPSDLRFQINDLNIRDNTLLFDGLAKTHAQAEEIAAALRQSGLYEVDPPKTQSNPQGVTFTFSAKPISHEKPHAKAE